jgi:hypothetical protein
MKCSNVSFMMKKHLNIFIFILYFLVKYYIIFDIFTKELVKIFRKYSKSFTYNRKFKFSMTLT